MDSATDSDSAQAGTSPRNPVDRMVDGAHEAIDRLAARASPMYDRLRDSTREKADSLRTRADEALDDIDERWLDDARRFVREKPLTALALGVLAGVVLSRLSSSR